MKSKLLHPGWLLAALGLALILGLRGLIGLRLSEGDVYAAGSTLRADPLGTKAFFEALGELPGRRLAAERSFRAFARVARPPDGTQPDLAGLTAFLLGEQPADWNWRPDPERLDEIEKAARAGARVVVGFSTAARPQRALGPDEEPKKPGAPEKADAPPAAAERRREAEERQRRRFERDAAKKNKDAREAKKIAEEEETAERSFFDALRRGMARGERLDRRWGADFRREPWRPPPADFKAWREERGRAEAEEVRPEERSVTPALPRAPDLTGRDTLPWRSDSPLDFVLSPTDAAGPGLWRVLYTRAGRPVVIERPFGRGSLVLVADFFFLTNEALFRDPNPAALAWLLGPDVRRVLFDEAALGTREDPGVMMLARRHGLGPFFLALLLLAALYVWKNAAPLVPPPPDPGARGAPPQGGLAAAEAVPALLRRAVAPAGLARLAFDQWRSAKRGQGGRTQPTPEREERLARLAEDPAAAKDPAGVYRRMREALAGGRSKLQASAERSGTSAHASFPSQAATFKEGPKGEAKVEAAPAVKA